MGSNDMPELGSRISLISKADIRYEGKLFTVDPQDCTIALANVRSFGTEDRETSHPVPAQNQVYDYILFRATDIKDISVIPSQQLLYDPAIVQLSAPPSISSRGFQSGVGSQGGGGGGGGGFTHPVLGSMGGGGGGFNPMQSGLQAAIQTRPQPPPSEFSHTSTNDLLSGSRSSTPGLRKGPSPTVDQAIQANSRKLPSPPKDKFRNQQQHGGNRNAPQQHQQMNQQHQQRNQQQNRNQRDNYNHNQMGGYQLQSGYNNQGGGGQQGGGGGMNQGGPQGGNRWPRGQGRMAMRGNRGGGGGGGQRNFSRAPGTAAKKQPLKFESDYDFDKANTEFEELRTQLAKVKIGEGEAAAQPAVAPVVPPPQQNGEEKKDDSGNETAIGDGEVDEVEFFYNKKKSFYDNISCEAIERSKGRSQRTDWRKERKLNSETFGVSMARRQGMYRGGRGGYYQQGGRGPAGNTGNYYQPRNNYRNYNRQHNNKTNNRQQSALPIQSNTIEVAKA